jgi:hypothetical protein
MYGMKIDLSLLLALKTPSAGSAKVGAFEPPPPAPTTVAKAPAA